MKFTKSVISALKYYVYLYSNPTTGEVFYVGKGKGNRAFAHLDDPSDSKKVEYIRKLRAQGIEPKIEMLIHGLVDEKTALRVESSIIDLISIKKLTNVQSGYKSSTFGRMSLEQIASAYDKQPIKIKVPAILIRINQAFRHSMTEMELYDYTRGQWKLNPANAKKAKYAFSIYGGIVQEVYEVLDWYEAGKTYSVREGNEKIKRERGEGLEGRYEFIGNLASEDVRNRYKYKSVEAYFKPGNSNPIMYVNVGVKST